MKEKFIIYFLVCCFGVNLIVSKKTFLVIGPQNAPYQGKYSVAVSSSGYDKPETIEVKLVGKDGDKVFYENAKNVTLKKDAFELIDFDLKKQTPGNYFIKVRNDTFNQSMRLNLNTKKFSVLIQTDKAIYKPGDKVQFRVLLLNPQTKPFMPQSVEIFITDGEFNRIKQYGDTFFRKGVFRQELQLSGEPILGLWNIHVRVNGDELEKVQSFEVAEYVLPKFDVTVKTKSKIGKTDDIVVSFDAKYTYGKEVEGTAIVSVELIDSWWEETVKRAAKILDSSTKTTSFNLANDLSLVDITWMRTVLITVTFTEALTGKQQNGTAIVQIFPIPYDISITGSDNAIKPDIPFTVKAFVKDINDVPINDDKQPVFFNITFVYDTYEETDKVNQPPFIFWWRPPKQKTFTITKFLKNGIAEIPINVTPNVTSVDIASSYKEAVTYWWLGTAPTESNQYIDVKIPGENLPISKMTQIEIISNVKVNSVNYIIIARNKIVKIGKLKGSNGKSFSFNFQPTIEMIPTANIIAFYVTPNGEIISDRKILNFDVELKNFVNIELSKTEARPGSLVNISVKSIPKSYIGLLGVDQSVLLLKSGNDIDKNVVSDELTKYLYADQYNNNWDEIDTFSYHRDFQASELVILTNANDEYRRPYPYQIFPSPIGTTDKENGAIITSTARPAPTTTINPENIPSPGEIITRKEFPETWLFDCIDNIKGNATITRRVPDTITSWIITGFALDTQNGLGLSKQPSKLNVFLPFFVSLNLPYSIKRGEIISIQAVVFNYMNQDYPAVVTISNDKQEYEFVENAGNKQLIRNITAKSNRGTPVKFTIKALKIGYITLKIEARTSIAGDRIEQPLLVEAEGIKRYENEAMLIDLRSQQTFGKSVIINVPQNAVPDSLKIEASFIGDILGPTIDNLDDMLLMPYGCGEQNMLNFVPDIIILDYLTAVNRITPQIEAKAKRYMEDGYQRELTYKRFDGSYSAFGNNDKLGSTWLTAFVARSFNQASKYITIDQTAILQALNFLQTVQSDDGSFPEFGIVHHKPLQGGSSSGTGLTAYVLITFLENEALNGTYKKVIEKAVNNLLGHVKDINDVYTMSIVTYALYLAGEKSHADSLLQELDKRANNTLGTRHWDKVAEDSQYFIMSLSIETSAYALMSYLQANRDTDALLIVKWLVSQRNAFGGFASTQDTVIGLLALSKIAAKISGKSLDMKVNVQYQNISKVINIAQSNALVLQTVEISSPVRKVEISANGSGLALAQVSWHYNINDPNKATSFILNSDVLIINSYGFGLNVSVQLKNGLNQSNMAVMEISSPSGYVFDDENKGSIIGSAANVKRVDFKNGNTLIQIYFDYLSTEIQWLTATLTKAFDVADPKPASIVVYDYYENDLRTEMFYTPNTS